MRNNNNNNNNNNKQSILITYIGGEENNDVLVGGISRMENKTLWNINLRRDQSDYHHVTNTKKKEKRVISMSLYGSKSRYINGAIANAKLISSVFPGWKLRMYVPHVKNLTRRERKKMEVPHAVINHLKLLNVEIILIDPSATKINPMMWRFLIGNDNTVDRFIVRDVDSRLITRDAVEVEKWIQSGKPFHCIRDHPFHSKYPVSGGLWGAVTSNLSVYLKNTTFSYTLTRYSSNFFQDMIFLKEAVWPNVKHVSYCSDSFSCKKWESSFPFSTNRTEKLEIVGEVFDGNGKRRQHDVDAIRKQHASLECIPR